MYIPYIYCYIPDIYIIYRIYILYITDISMLNTSDVGNIGWVFLVRMFFLFIVCFSNFASIRYWIYPQDLIYKTVSK